LLEDADSIARAAEQLLQRYGSQRKGSAALCISSEALGAEATNLATSDVSGDGVLDQAELGAFLRRPGPQLVADAQVPQAKPGKRKLAVVEDHLAHDSPGRKGGVNRLAFSANGIDLELYLPVAQSARMDARDNRAFYRTRFLQADQDKNKYLSEPEFAAVGIRNADFKSVDRDGNGMVTIDELMAHLE